MKRFHIQHPLDAAKITVSKFEGRDTGDEYHIMIKDSPASNIEAELSDIGRAYDHALSTLGLSGETAVFRRLFVSDYVNQKSAIDASSLVKGDEKDGPVCVSVVEQPPLPNKRICLWAYHVGDCSFAAKEKIKSGLMLRREASIHIWSAGLADTDESRSKSSFDQTDRIFDEYERQLASLGATLADDVLRTWIYVQNVDVNYEGMVKSRKALFEKRGLKKDTHYISSTGIEGRYSDPKALVLMDAYAATGLKKDQIRFLQALDHLGPTSDYGVTFERGTSVDYADRRHIMISGTASIDPKGRTLHLCDVLGQTKRALENVGALFKSADATFDDTAHLIVYLRDIADYEIVSGCVQKELPDVPVVFVKAPVCRPQWLVEFECMAIVPADNPNAERF